MNNKSSRLQHHDVYSQPMESPVRNAKIGKMFGSMAPSQSSAPAQQRKLIGQCSSFSASKNIFHPDTNSSVLLDMDNSMLNVHFVGTERIQ